MMSQDTDAELKITFSINGESVVETMAVVVESPEKGARALKALRDDVDQAFKAGKLSGAVAGYFKTEG